MEPMTLTAVLFASLIGSTHCIAMCGGLVGYCSSSCPKSSMPQFSYHLGRLLSYCAIGLIAGYFGSQANEFGKLAGYQHLASILAGLTLLVVGIRTIISNGKALNIEAPKGTLAKLMAWALQASSKLHIFGYSPQALLLGIFTGFLPCGWLYSFALVAAASGSPYQGALTMFVFWAGSLPALLALGSATKFMTNSIGKYSPQLTATLLIFAGLYSIFNRGHHHKPEHHQHSPSQIEATETQFAHPGHSSHMGH